MQHCQHAFVNQAYTTNNTVKGQTTLSRANVHCYM